ncbi:unnamed protein product [Urochloa humidicola]
MLRRLFQGCFIGTSRKDALSAHSVGFDMLEKKLEDPLAMPIPLPLDFLKSITHDFSNEQKIGQGGFGVVYKGILQNGKTIAVKKLSEMHLDDDRFDNEVTYLIGVKHENIVELLGYCAESRWEATQVSGKYVMAEIRHRLICFEYINNKSLDEYISAADRGLNWDERFRIIRGICDGLHYLHETCGIIHLDLKPQNILMDDHMVPKIADFGTSRLFGPQESRIITESFWGTLGYMPPECVEKRPISSKSDIFGLGVIIIELLIGFRDYPLNIEASSGDFIENNVIEQWRNLVIERWRNRFRNTSEYKLFETCYIQQINKCTVMGLRCVDSDPEKRPAAWDIIKMLDATTEYYVFHAGSEQLHHSGPSFDLFSSRLMAPAPSSSLPASVLPYKTANVRDYYRIGKKLGQGHSGTTYRCVRKADGAQYACKSIPKRKLLCREDYEDVYREIQIMHHLSDHPNVTHIQGTYEDALFVHIVMELCAGWDLLDRIISKQGHYSERTAAQLIRKIIGIVDGCHSLGVMHGNLKPENLLFDSNDEDAAIKLTDFEFSMFYMPGDKFSRTIGSTYYVAPEVLQECYGPEADIWSVGVILYILLSGVPPFWAETEEGTFSEILQGKLDFESDPWPSISDSAKDVVRRMLTRDPKKRLSAHEVFCHPWIIDDAVAPNKPTDSAVLSRLKHFSAMNMFTKMALKEILWPLMNSYQKLKNPISLQAVDVRGLTARIAKQ